MLTLPELVICWGGAPWAAGGAVFLLLGRLYTGETGARGNWGSVIFSLCWAVAPRAGLGPEFSLWGCVILSLCWAGAPCVVGGAGSWPSGTGLGAGTCCVGGRVFDLWRSTGSLPLAILSR